MEERKGIDQDSLIDLQNPAQDKDKEIDFIITKFSRKGFESLSLEELAVTMVVPNFASRYQTQTGQKWTTDIQMKCVERLRRCNFDLTWMTKQGASGETEVLFDLIRSGDIARVIEFLRKGKDMAKTALDSKKRTALHISAEVGSS